MNEKCGEKKIIMDISVRKYNWIQKWGEKKIGKKKILATARQPI